MTERTPLLIELDHFYKEDYEHGQDYITERLAHAAFTASFLTNEVEGDYGTVHMIDDYNGTGAPPSVILPMLWRASQETGTDLHYIAREAACAPAAKVSYESLLAAARILDHRDPVPHGPSRSQTLKEGWMVDRTTEGTVGPASYWRGPQRYRLHTAIEIFNRRKRNKKSPEETIWSCSFLATAFRLAALGEADGSHGLREPHVVENGDFNLDELGDKWETLPLLQLKEGAPPFQAHRILSILPQAYMQTEAAVDRTLAEYDAANNTDARSRVEVAFFQTSWRALEATKKGLG